MVHAKANTGGKAALQGVAMTTNNIPNNRKSPIEVEAFDLEESTSAEMEKNKQFIDNRKTQYEQGTFVSLEEPGYLCWPFTGKSFKLLRRAFVSSHSFHYQCYGIIYLS